MGTNHIFQAQLRQASAYVNSQTLNNSSSKNYIVNKFCAVPLQLAFFAVHATAS